MAAAYVERDDHPVAGLDVLDVAADLLDDAHRLVPDDVPLAHKRGELGVEVEVRPTNGARGDAHYGVGGLLDDRVGNVVNPYVFLAVPDYGLHGSLPPTPVSISRTLKGPPVFGESGGVSRPEPVLSPSRTSSTASSALRPGAPPRAVAPPA